MKKYLALILSIVLVLAILPTSIFFAASSGAKAVTPGDVNGDEVLNVTDCVKIMMHVNGKATLEGAALEAADFDKNGSVEKADAEALAKKIASGKNGINTGSESTIDDTNPDYNDDDFFKTAE